MEEEFNKGDELVIIKLPRSEAEALRVMLKRETTYNYITASVKSGWVWVVAGGLLTTVTLWDKIIELTSGVK